MAPAPSSPQSSSSVTPARVFASMLVVAACGTDLGDPAPDAAAPLVPPIACGTALPGPAFQTLETAPGYATELAALDLSRVPDPYDFGREIGLTRGLVNYMLGRDGGTSFTRAEAEAAGPLGRAVLGAVAKVNATAVDLPFLRRGLYYAYPCTVTLPATLTELSARYGDYETWPARIDDCAPPKGKPRRVLSNHAAGVYVAETLDAAGVRETEVIFTNLEGRAALDFGVYTPDGRLSDRSTFATTGGTDIVGAAPFTCLTCHVDRESWTFSIQRPVGTGAGCP